MHYKRNNALKVLNVLFLKVRYLFRILFFLPGVRKLCFATSNAMFTCQELTHCTHCGREKKEENVVKNCNEFRDDGQINTRLEKYVCCSIMRKDISN